jgi:hypothetical protein
MYYYKKHIIPHQGNMEVGSYPSPEVLYCKHKYSNNHFSYMIDQNIKRRDSEVKKGLEWSCSF